MKQNKFPWKKSIIGSVLITIVAFMLLALLYTFVNSIGENDYLWIALLVWGVLFGGGLIFFWVYQLYTYLDNQRKCEANKKNKN